jgi:MFS family permease
VIGNVRSFIKIYGRSTGNLVGTVAGTALSGVLMQYTDGGWPSVFYLFGSLGVLWFIFWIFLFYNNPQSHPFISEEERIFLEKNIDGISNRKVSVIINCHDQTSYIENQRTRLNF